MKHFLKSLRTLSWQETTFLTLLFLRPTLDIWRDFSLFAVGSHSINLTAVLSLCLVFLAVLILPTHLKLFKKDPLVLTWLLFLVLAVGSSVYSFDTASTLVETLKLVGLCAAFLVAYVLVKNNVSFKARLATVLVASALVPVAVALYQWITKTGVTIDETVNRVYGTFAHPNILALFCLITLGGVWYFYENKQVRSDSALPLAPILLLFAIFATYTRIVWLALLLGFALYIFLRFKKLFWWLAAIGFGSLLLLGATYSLLPTTYQLKVQSVPLIKRVVYRPTNADSAQWRWWVLRDSLKIATKNPIFGFGYGTFPVVWDTYKDPARRGDPSNEAHNDYIRILIEEGVIGLAVYGTLFFLLFRNAWKKYIKSSRKQTIFFVSILLYCLVAFSENMLHHTAPAWWLWSLWGAWSRD